MRYLVRVFTTVGLTIALTAGMTQLAFAAEPADRIIKTAADDITRFEQQAQGLNASRKSSARRILKLMNLSYQRLGTSANQSHESWQQVNQRYLALQAQLQNLLAPAASGTAQAQQATQPGSTGALQSAASTTQATAAAADSGGDIKPLVSGQRVRVKKLQRDISSVTASIVTTGPSVLQNADELAAKKKRFEQFTDAIARYPQQDDPDVKAARQAYLELRQTLTAEYQRAQGQLAELGDVQLRLRTVQENYTKYPVPAALSLPFSRQQASDWVAAASGAKTVAEHNHKELGQMAAIAYLPQTRGTPESGAAYDASDLQRLQQWAQSVVRTLEANHASMQQSLSNEMNTITMQLDQRWQEAGDGDKGWIYTADGREQEAFDYFAKSQAIAESAVHLATALGQDAQAAQALIARIEQGRERFLANKELAISSARMPRAASDDAQMTAFARSILDNPQYEFGEYGPIVLTTPSIVTREREDSEIDIDDVDVSASGDVKMSGTQTTWTYKWQEFKFATVLRQEDGTLNIWWITGKNYSSGASNTPLNRWIAGASTKGSPILSENIDW